MNKTHGLTLQNSSFRGFFFVSSDRTSLFDAAGAGRIACFHGFLVAGEQDLILLCRQVRAAGQMELFAVHIADVGLLGCAGRRRVGGIQRGICCKVLGAYGVVLAVGTNGDGALQVGAVDIHPGVPQDAQGLLVGVAVLVFTPQEMTPISGSTAFRKR